MGLLDVLRKRTDRNHNPLEDKRKLNSTEKERLYQTARMIGAQKIVYTVARNIINRMIVKQ